MLKEHFHVKQEETMAFGDNFNDIDMIRYAGLGVAMGNETDEVKEAADIITYINDNEGERQILDKYFKQEEALYKIQYKGIIARAIK